jgi:hypothetical protein
MTTFDASTTGGQLGVRAEPEARYYHGEEPVPAISALDMLRNEIEHRDAQERELCPVEIPGLAVRLMCRTDFPATEWESWQRLAIPKAKRNSRKLGPTDMQQHVLYTLVLVNTCERLEFRTGSAWSPITGHDDGVLDLHSKELLDRFNQVDPASLLRKLFARDADLLRAGQRVVDAAGYGEEDGSSENPTE